MSTTTPTDRDQQSFAETALRLGGKTEEEARRTGAVDKADEQVESLFAAVPDGQQPHPQGRLGRQVPLDLFAPPPLAAVRAVRWQHGGVAGHRPPPPRGDGTLYDDKGKVSAETAARTGAAPATGACSSIRSYGGQGAPFARFTPFLTRMATYDSDDRRPGLGPRLHRRRRSGAHLRHARAEGALPAAAWPAARRCPASP